MISRDRRIADPGWEPSYALPDEVIGRDPNLAAFQLTAKLPVNLELTFLSGLMEKTTQSADTSSLFTRVFSVVWRGMAMLLPSGNARQSSGPTPDRLAALTGVV